uniref:Endopeptidase S2P n=1 Tax=Spongospora subterranea TaxID=70186 RepID=A0A0H5QK86_9EUKA|eukprot:CRZ02037.1 hypothetical protein [Spongospora subterranea]
MRQFCYCCVSRSRLCSSLFTSRSLSDIVPLIPGITFPIWQALYLWVSLLVSIVCHELGHFLCAVAHDIPVIAVGIHILFFVPSAFVEVDQGELLARSQRVSRAVFAAGILHNFAIAAVAGLALLLLPLLIFPLYRHDLHPTIVWTSPMSPLSNISSSGDTRLMFLNDITVSNSDDLPGYLSSINSAPAGICLDPHAISAAFASNGDTCCQNASPEYCFSHIDGHSPFCISSRNSLPPRSISCDNSTPCTDPLYSTCAIVPGSHVIYIQSSQAVHIFIGHPFELLNAIEVTDYVPRFGRLFPVRGALWMSRFLTFLASTSLSLGVVNSAPVHYLDGEHLALTFGRTRRQKRLIQHGLSFGSVALMVNIVLSVATKTAFAMRAPASS